MAEDFDLILDGCIDRINHGDSLADCLSDYPVYSERLKPLLQSMYDIQKVYSSAPSADAKRAARHRLYTALDRQQRRKPVLPFFKPTSQPLIWATAAVLILAIVGALAIQSLVNGPTLVPNADGNFAFLVSDEPDDINDFESFNITISGVELQAAGSKEWFRFIPEIQTVDLTQLQGERYQEIWRGNLPAGQYSHVHIYVSEAEGNLKLTGQTIDLRVPGGVVHMPIPFEVVVDKVTIYTFDITVVGTNTDGTYMLKLQISDCGAQQTPKVLK